MLSHATTRDWLIPYADGMLAADEVGSTIEVVSDEGDAQTRNVELDWVLLATRKDVDRRALGDLGKPCQHLRQNVLIAG